MKTKTIGRMFYAADRAAKVYCMADIAKRIGTNNNYVWRQIYVRKVWPEPTVLVGKRMLFEECVFLNIIKDYETSVE